MGCCFLVSACSVRLYNSQVCSAIKQSNFSQFPDLSISFSGLTEGILGAKKGSSTKWDIRAKLRGISTPSPQITIVCSS